MKFRLGIFYVVIIISSFVCSAHAQSYAFRNAKLSIDARVNDLLSRLTLNEKISLLGYQSAAVPRLNIPAYNWWNEGLHGVARAGEATVFPQAIGMAATFNDDLIKQVGNVISTEARAKNNLAIKKGQHQQYMGLTFWSPNINIFRDPRWGRGPETYGEDPFLTAHIGLGYVTGMQGTDPLHLKTAATAKHFVAHSGPESQRDYFDAIVPEKDLHETYLYAFGALVKGGVASVMTAYNRVNGMPNSINNNLLTDVLRKEWSFKGYVVTDCGALDDIYLRHKTLPNATQVAAAAIKAGIDLDCSTILQKDVIKAIDQKLLTEKEVDNAVADLLRIQFRLGFYDDPNKSLYRTYKADSVHNASHIQLARKVAQESMILLKNNKNVLPLKKQAYSSIMVVGPNAASLDALVGSYHGVSSKMVNFVEGITSAVDPATRVEYDLGTDYRDTTHFGGIWAAGMADVTVAVIGLTPVVEGEAGDAFLAESGGDRKNLSLPAGHIAFMRSLRRSVKKPIIAVVTGGSDIDIAAIEPYADAIILAWYPGEQGGNALADIIFGNISPSGHLPLTFYRSIRDLPEYTSYSMKGRTYRYFGGDVQYPFGFGLSYTSFKYDWLTKPFKSYNANATIDLNVRVFNTGEFNGDEVVQAYIKYPQMDGMPIKELKGFKRIFIKKNGQQTVQLKIPVKELQKWNVETHKWQLYPGDYRVFLGSNSTDEKLTATFSISNN
jgi:beta-glucosidase